jgi:two-component system chemotaxis sensor kinase CheA
MHMVRNSLDHGIEPPQVRKDNGKPSLGIVELNAFHRGGNIMIEIKDDGGGLNKNKILKKAKEKGLVKESESMSESRIFGLIFEPGFSTADKITDISGRGVGMDVVKRNIDLLRGKIDIESVEGKGTKFTIKLPLTLAIIDGIILGVGAEHYIIPVNSVIEFFGPRQQDVTVVAGKGEMILFHGELFQLIRLDQVFSVAASYRAIEESTVCLVESDYGRAAILVDHIVGQQQVVIKSLGDKLKDIQGISGGTILGDGKVGLILDVNGIIQKFRQ